MKLKVGDKIKFVGVIPKRWIGEIGIIKEVRECGREFPYSIKLNTIPSPCSYPVLAWEIEPVLRKGEQLLLFDL